MIRAVLGGVVATLAGLACSGKPRTDEAPHPAAGGDAASSVAAGSAASSSAAAAGGHAVAGGSAANTGSAVDLGGAAPGGGAATGGSAAAGSGSAARGAGRSTGELSVRVEWRDVPVAARSSPGRTPCGTPRAPQAAPTTTWGVPDALVIVDGAPPPADPPVARIALADCALAPGIAVGASLAITSAVDRPARLTLRKRGALGQLVAGDAVPVLLPIAGHTVTATLDAGAIYTLETDAADPELAYIAALPARVSDAAGHALVRDLAPGPHAVTAWLPPRAGQPARSGRGSASVVAGELAELTVVLSP
jgi:hypothetical protein